MFKNEIQPSVISLFSSTGSHPLSLWQTETDAGLPKDSHITLIDDDTMCPGKEIDYVNLEDDEMQSHTLSHPVLHIQSPTLPSTFIRCPPSPSDSLGISLPWLHLQFRNLGRPWAFEIGLVDLYGHLAAIRCCTFQVSLQAQIPVTGRRANTLSFKEEALVIRGETLLMLIPLKLPSPPSASTFSPALTSWLTLSIDLRALSNHFGSKELDTASGDASRGTQARTPHIRFTSVTYVKVYATCRLRRLWFSKDKEQEGVRRPWELELYG